MTYQKPMVPGPWLPNTNLDAGAENLAIFGISLGITLGAFYLIYRLWK